MAPTRVISGQQTKLARTIHGIAYDAETDEIIVPNPIAAAILVFRGGASGAEAPIRVIQGLHTQLVHPHAVNVDSANGEILVGDTAGRQVLVFSLKANGDTPPIRVIKGPQTGLGYVVGVAADPIHDLLVVSSGPSGSSSDPSSIYRGVLIFKRTDNGDVPPQAAITGPNTGIIEGSWQLQVDPKDGKIFVAVSNALNYRPRYVLGKLRDSAGRSPIQSPWGSQRLGFVGVWNISDDGDVPPRRMIKGPVSGLVHPAGVALNLLNNEIIVTDSVRNGALVFSGPEFFAGLEKERAKAKQ
jgi:hypothetical protein